MSINHPHNIDKERAALRSSAPVKDLRDNVIITSCVGGGPMERLANRLSERGLSAKVHADDTPESWRARLRSGRIGHLRTRLRSYVRHPLTSVAQAFKPTTRLIIPTTNPFFMPFVMVATRPLHGKSVITLIYDLYPDALEIAGLSPDSIAGLIMARMNTYTFKHADAVVFIGTKTAAHARARYGDPKHWKVIETGADADELSPDNNDGPPQSSLERWCRERTVFSYIGNMGMAHDWETLRDAIPILFRELPPDAHLGILIASLGPRVDALKEAWKDLPSESIRFVDPLSDDEWSRILCCSDASFVTLTNAARMTCIPSKALSALCAGSALLIVAPKESDVASLAELGVGELVPPGDSVALAQSMLKMVTDHPYLRGLRQQARGYAESKFDIRELAKLWERLIADVERKPRTHTSYARAKRTLDIIFAASGILATAPVWAPAALSIRATMGSPVLFRQPRPGKDGAIFELAKFRTMRAAKPHETGPDHDGNRITRLGQFLRSTSIDELPTLWNVLRGDMSLVGPRPLLVRYLERYSTEQARRHEVPPGVTGWAQVHGRNAISWEEKFERDVWYVDHRSLALDLWILLQTVGKVLKRDDISQTEHATMPEFMGSSQDTPQ